MTFQQMCEHIVKSGITTLTAEEIFNLSPTGELFHVFELYEAACAALGANADGTPYCKIVGIDSVGNFVREL